MIRVCRHRRRQTVRDHPEGSRRSRCAEEAVRTDEAGQLRAVSEGYPPMERMRTYEDWKERGFDAHSAVGDPLFVGTANDDYSLQPDSPAFKLGLKPINLSTVGLRGRGEE